ncbi:MAG: molybdopterin-binding protein, partial [Myxococcota bacterium]
MKVAALITGSELLDGHVTDTNTGHLARELASVGISLSRTMSVRDMQGEISATLAALAGTNDLVVVSGGIGPTDDDVTMNAVALSTGTTVADGIPSCARRLENRAGTADGAHLKIGTADVFVFPGVPLEFEFFVREHLLTFLEGRSSGEVTGSRVIKAFGLGEARINELV